MRRKGSQVQFSYPPSRKFWLQRVLGSHATVLITTVIINSAKGHRGKGRQMNLTLTLQNQYTKEKDLVTV